MPKAEDMPQGDDHHQRIRAIEFLPAIATLHIKVFPDELMDGSFPVTGGDGKFIFAFAEDMNEMHLTRAEAFVTTVSTAGDIIVGVRNVTLAADMLVEPLQIDEGDKNSMTSVAPVEIVGNALFWGDEVAVDVWDPGTDAFGLGVILEFTR